MKRAARFFAHASSAMRTKTSHSRGGCMMRCRGGASGAGWMRSRCCRAMTFTNRWTAGFGCEKQLSVAGCQLSVRFFLPFVRKQAKG